MEQHLKMATFMANFLDNSAKIGGLRFGASAVIDLIPGIGDFIDAFLSLYLVWIALQLQIPTLQIIRMLFNIFVNFILGLIPVVGDVGYFFYKANLRNLAILKQYAKTPNIIDGEMVT
jgi:hypothetical protein